jgi:hypothetical protein
MAVIAKHQQEQTIKIFKNLNTIEIQGGSNMTGTICV